MLFRVAKFVAAADERYDASKGASAATAHEFFAMMDAQDFMPNSPTFTGAGTELGQLSACFVLPIEDSLTTPDGRGIYDTLRDQALIHQTGGGTGFDFSHLRPAGSPVRRSQGVASGPISFLEAYNASTGAIKQGGTRRGANMGILRVDHPDVLNFIRCKDDTTKFTNFNISVGITDEFMAALLREEHYFLKHEGQPWIDPKTGAPGTLSAQWVWDTLIEAAWKTGEPGVVFIDRMNRRNPNNHAEVIEATNPCGEQPLPPYGSCNLGSVNLGNFVVNPYTPEARVDWFRLGKVVHTAVHFLDNVIDTNKYPIPQLEQKARRDRRIGLGVMGWAEMLVMMGLPYGSIGAVNLAVQVRRFMKRQAIEASKNLAQVRGPYPDWVGSAWFKAGLMVRNATLMTVAPTGTISLIAAKPDQPCSGGIEPKFAVAFTRKQAGQVMLDVDGQFEKLAKERYFWSEHLEQHLLEHGTIEDSPLPAPFRALFANANNIAPEWHVRHQAAWQGSEEEGLDGICAATSKTINFANNAFKTDVDRSYRLAWELGLKGITVYRDGARDGQVLTSGKQEQKAPVVVTLSDETQAHLEQAQAHLDASCHNGSCEVPLIEKA